MRQYRILLIDDNEALGKLYRTFLGSEGYDVAVANNGKAGLGEVDRLHPDLVILDVALPDMDGFAVLSAIREKRSLPVIMLSGVRKEIASKVKGLDIGADDYLTKPLSLPVLLQRVQAVLRRYCSE